MTGKPGANTINGPEMYGLKNVTVSVLLEGLEGILDYKNYQFRKRNGLVPTKGKRRSKSSRMRTIASRSCGGAGQVSLG